MKRGVHAFLLTGASVALLWGQFAAAAPVPMVGEWELDAAASSASAGGALTSGHVLITAKKDTFTSVVDVVPAGGAAMHYESTGKADGNPISVTGSTYFDSYSMVNVDKLTAIRTERRGGKVVGFTTIEVSKDGKTMTVNTKATLADGHRVTRTSVWHRAKAKKK